MDATSLRPCARAETWVHLQLYRARPDVAAIARAQPPAAFAAAATTHELRPYHGQASWLGRVVPVYDDARLLRSPELAEAAVRVLTEGEALLLRGNGAITTGAAPGLAVARMWLLSAACEIWLTARQDSRSRRLTDAEIASWRAVQAACRGCGSTCGATAALAPGRILVDRPGNAGWAMPHAAHGKRHDHTEQWLFEGRGSHLYDRLSGLLGRRLHRRVAADVSAGAPAGGAVLDVGAGTGRMLVEIGSRRSDLKLFGIDLSPDMVALAQRHLSDAGFAGRASMQAGDVAELPYPDDSFDLIVSAVSMHHWADVAAGVRELGRVLRPGGKLWIYDFRFVSDREFTVAARAEPVFGGQPVLRTLLRPGLLPIYVRLAQSRPPTAP